VLLVHKQGRLRAWFRFPGRKVYLPLGRKSMRVACGENSLGSRFGAKFHIARQQNAPWSYSIFRGWICCLFSSEAEARPIRVCLGIRECKLTRSWIRNHMARPHIVFWRTCECNHSFCCNVRLKSRPVVIQSAIIHVHHTSLQL
jgi:hypothetical protein